MVGCDDSPGGGEDVPKAEVGDIAYEGTGRVQVASEEPLDAGNGESCNRQRNQWQGRLSTQQARVDKASRKARVSNQEMCGRRCCRCAHSIRRRNHEQDQASGCEHERNMPGLGVLLADLIS